MTDATTDNKRKQNGVYPGGGKSPKRLCAPTPREAAVSAILGDSADALAAVLGAHPGELHRSDAGDRTLLHAAAASSAASCVRLLLDRGLRAHRHMDLDDCTPLQLAAAAGCTASVVALTRAGACPREGFAPSTPLAEAARHDREPAVALLLSLGADPCACGGDRELPLHAAAPAASPGTLWRLVHAGSPFAARSHVCGPTPLELAARAGNAGNALVLLRAGAPLDLDYPTRMLGTLRDMVARVPDAAARDLTRATLGRWASGTHPVQLRRRALLAEASRLLLPELAPICAMYL